MNKLPVDVMLSDCLEAEVYYRMMDHRMSSESGFQGLSKIAQTGNIVIADAYSLRADTIIRHDGKGDC